MTGNSHIPFVTSCSYPPRAGNNVRPLVDAMPAYRRITEAVRAAQHSVWLTVTFFAPDFELPDGAGLVFDLLDQAVARGLDVRVIFWRPNPESMGYGSTFSGTAEQRAMLAARGSRFRIRWDRASGPYCQHQKSWLIDAGQSIRDRLCRRHQPDHDGAGIARPSDAKANATISTLKSPDPRQPTCITISSSAGTKPANAWKMTAPGATTGDDGLRFPQHATAPRGDSVVQIQRMVHSGRYTDPHPTPGGDAFDIAGGERSILTQYLQAIGAARRSIYIENQAIPVPEVSAALEQALQRGVEIVLLAPG